MVAADAAVLIRVRVPAATAADTMTALRFIT
jgi:hypothetical protein